MLASGTAGPPPAPPYPVWEKEKHVKNEKTPKYYVKKWGMEIYHVSFSLLPELRTPQPNYPQAQYCYKSRYSRVLCLYSIYKGSYWILPVFS